MLEVREAVQPATEFANAQGKQGHTEIAPQQTISPFLKEVESPTASDEKAKFLLVLVILALQVVFSVGVLVNLVKDHKKRLARIAVFFFQKLRVGQDLFLMGGRIPVQVPTLRELVLIALRQCRLPHLARATDKRHLVELRDDPIDKNGNGAV